MPPSTEVRIAPLYRSRTVHSMLRWACRNVRQFVFVATTGRSGSASLAHVLGRVRGVRAHHEPEPIMNGPVMAAYNRGDVEPVRRLWPKKAKRIYMAAAGAQIYVETNHMFIKSFFEPALEEFGDRLACIHLRRSAVDVAYSMYRVKSVPGLGGANDWVLGLDSPTNRLPMADLLAPGGRLDHDFYRCLWYWYEIEARTADYRRRYADQRWYRIDTDDINRPEGVKKLLDAMDVAPGRYDLDSLVGVRKNRKTKRKHAPGAELSDPQRRAMLEEFIAAAADRVDLPAIEN